MSVISNSGSSETSTKTSGPSELAKGFVGFFLGLGIVLVSVGSFLFAISSQASTKNSEAAKSNNESSGLLSSPWTYVISGIISICIGAIILSSASTTTTTGTVSGGEGGGNTSSSTITLGNISYKITNGSISYVSEDSKENVEAVFKVIDENIVVDLVNSTVKKDDTVLEPDDVVVKDNVDNYVQIGDGDIFMTYTIEVDDDTNFYVIFRKSCNKGSKLINGDCVSLEGHMCYTKNDNRTDVIVYINGVEYPERMSRLNVPEHDPKNPYVVSFEDDTLKCVPKCGNGQTYNTETKVCDSVPMLENQCTEQQFIQDNNISGIIQNSYRYIVNADGICSKDVCTARDIQNNADTCPEQDGVASFGYLRDLNGCCVKNEDAILR